MTIADLRSVVSLVETGLRSVVPGFMARPAVAAGRMRVLHTPASPVLNASYLACVRGRQNRPHIAAALEHLPGRPCYWWLTAVGAMTSTTRSAASGGVPRLTP